MKPSLYILFCFITAAYLPAMAQPPGEIFAPKRIVNANTASGRLRHPFAMIMGLNDSLWVTERRGFVIRINSNDGNKKTLLNISAKVKFTTAGSGASLSISQDGMFGIALHPDLNKGKGTEYVYLAYCYDSSGKRRTKIVRYQYAKSTAFPFGDTLKNEVVLLNGIHGSNDHNGGRLIIGNFGTPSVPDYKLLYTVGDRGANQYANACDSIEAQYLPTAAQITAGDLHRYNGKILRLNMDGSIPAGNPFLNGVRTHIWSYGHRNPQGLSFEKDVNNTIVPKGKLYSSEQGPASDDEINIIDSANNYGWPRIAGKKDNVWYKYYQWSASGNCGAYSGECSAVQSASGLNESGFSHPRLKDPVFDLYPGIPPGGSGCNWLTNPTLAPSSIAYYPFSNKIPNWKNCLLITTLKSSALYRLKLNAAGTGSLSAPDSVIQYFRDESALNRFRDVVISNDGTSIYIVTDSVGATSGPSGGSAAVTDRGCILEYKYTGGVLSVTENSSGRNSSTARNFNIYPNPVASLLKVDVKRNISRPLRYQLATVSGRTVLEGKTIRDKFEINVSRLPAGMYILKIYNGYGIPAAFEKIIVQ